MSKHFSIEPARMQALSERVAELKRWLAENGSYCESAQKHLDNGTVEQAYWHYGYLCALQDVVKAIHVTSIE
jgi:hypothetical protein